MHVRSVAHLEGLLLVFCAAFMLGAVPFAIYYGDGDTLALLLSAGITAICGYLLYRTTRIDGELRIREGLAVVTFGWLLISLFGTLPFLLSGAIPNFLDAFFETVSGFTTTGSSILSNIEAVPHGVLFWRSTTHWIGGMGIIVFSLAVLPYLGVGGMQLYKAEVAGPVADKLTPRVRETAKILWSIYLAITVAEVILLLMGGMSLFDALCQSFGTVSSGGFSTKNDSIAGFHSSYIDWVITFFMILAGTNFALHYRFLTRRWRAYWDDGEFRVFLLSMLVGCIVVGISTFTIYADKVTALRDTVFQVVTMQTSTGFATANYLHWSASAQFMLLLLMIIGGSAGSTSGGIKIIRFYAVLAFIRSEFTRLVHPQAVVPVRIRGTVVPRDVMINVLGFFALYGLAIFIATLAVTAAGVDWISSFSAVVSALGGVGPGMNQLGPFDNYGWLPWFAKWVLIACMLLGRLEFYTVLVIFAPDFWRK